MARNPLQVNKEQQLVIVMLRDQTRVKGYVHLPASGRLSDFMNNQANERPFVAMTNVIVRLPDGTGHQAPFLSVNRLSVTACFPTAEEPPEADAEDEAT